MFDEAQGLIIINLEKRCNIYVNIIVGTIYSAESIVNTVDVYMI